jgi:hypothetical protein
MTISYEAFVSVVDTNEAIDAAEEYGVNVVKQAGEPRMIQITGDYDAIMMYMTDYLGMTDAEADIMIDDVGVTNESAADVCPMCGEVHTDDSTCDYEECGYCGFDHSYDYEAAAKWHMEHPGVGYDEERSEDLTSARSSGSGRPFESKVPTLKALLEKFSTSVARPPIPKSPATPAQGGTWYAKYDGATDMYQVLNTAKPKVYASYLTAEEADEDVSKRNEFKHMAEAKKKKSLKSLLETNFAGPWNDTTQIVPGDKVDVYLPDSFTTSKSAVRVIELVDDVLNATGATAADSHELDSIDFTGPGFVGEFDEDSGESGQLVFSLHQIVPGSKEKYAALMDDDPYMNDANYERHAQYDDGNPKISDYYNDDDSPAAMKWRARPFGESKDIPLPKGAPSDLSLETKSFDKFMQKIMVQESHDANRKLIVEDSAMRKRANRHQERPVGRIRWSK